MLERGLVGYDFILNTIQVYDRGPPFWYLISVSCCWISFGAVSIWWLLISMYVLLSVDGQILRKQLIDVLDDNSSSAGFHPSPVFNSTLLCLFSECRWGQVWI